MFFAFLDLNCDCFLTWTRRVSKVYKNTFSFGSVICEATATSQKNSKILVAKVRLKGISTLAQKNRRACPIRTQTQKDQIMTLLQYADADQFTPTQVASLDVDELELRHFTALQMTRAWQEIWEIFYNNPWFRGKLRCCVRKAARDAGLRSDCYDDIQQEALVEFAKALQRNSSLGFLLSKGTFQAFVSTIIYRCCLKGLRQFQRRHRSMPDDDFMHPYYEEHSQFEKLMDFRHLANQISEPYRGIVRQLLAGESIDNIALSRKRSKRTIYRWVDRSVEMLKDRYFQE